MRRIAPHAYHHHRRRRSIEERLGPDVPVVGSSGHSRCQVHSAFCPAITLSSPPPPPLHVGRRRRRVVRQSVSHSVGAGSGGWWEARLMGDEIDEGFVSRARLCNRPAVTTRQSVTPGRSLVSKEICRQHRSALIRSAIAFSRLLPSLLFTRAGASATRNPLLIRAGLIAVLTTGQDQSFE